MKTIKRFLISIAIALVVAGATFLVAQAARPSECRSHTRTGAEANRVFRLPSEVHRCPGSRHPRPFDE